MCYFCRTSEFWGSAILFHRHGHRQVGLTTVRKVLLQHFEVGGRALAWNEAQLHQPARRIVDEDQQCAGLPALFEPAVLAPVDLDQLTVARAEAWAGGTFAVVVANSQRPSATIQRRKVSRPTRSSCFSSRTSVASVGPKSAYLVLTNSTAYCRMPAFTLRFDVLPRA